MKIFLDSANVQEIKEAVSWAAILRTAALPSPTPPTVGCPARSGAKRGV